MTEATGANLGLGSGWPPGFNGYGPILNADLRALDALVFFVTQSAPVNDPPGSPALGDRYIIGTAPTGAWAANAANLVVWTQDETNTALWQFFAPKDGWQALIVPSDGVTATTSYIYRVGAWAIINPGGGTFAGLEDVNVAEGAGIDGYSPAWDNATTKWVAKAPVGVMGKSGVLHAPGLTPDTPSTAGSIRFLREDGVWATPSAGSGTGSTSSTLELSLGSTTLTGVSNIVLEGALELTGDDDGNATITATGGALEIDNGTTTLTGITGLTVIGATSLTGTSGEQATLTVTGGGGGSGSLLAMPSIGSSMLGRSSYQRPLLSAMTLLRASGLVSITDINTAASPTGPIVMVNNGNDGTARGAYIAHGLSAPFHVKGLFQQSNIQTDPTTGPANVGGICLYETASGKALLAGGSVQNYESGHLAFLEINADGTEGTYIISKQDFSVAARMPLWASITWNEDGTVTYGTSNDDYTYTDLATSYGLGGFFYRHA